MITIRSRLIKEQEHHKLDLPDEIILTKVQDTETLVRCSSASRRFQAIVSKIDTVFLSYVRKENSQSCTQPHCHIPLEAVPALMKVFSNVKFLKVKLCSVPNIARCRANHASMFNAKIDDDQIDVRRRVAIQDSYPFRGKVFMTRVQLANLVLLDQLSKSSHQHGQGWLEEPKNAAYWLKNQHNVREGETLWHIVYESESLHQLTAERDLKELMGDFD
ncbi:hypothetical protein DKX38_005135 [Salix brachista]|uniref:F-box domain-containing protein n=1 Tax=Salix brachista TaxID=2182728 RepID=A0A5N5NEZ7_9ROSI|nr:hypothetical protein DKX38_005135 [Salix brachista]